MKSLRFIIASMAVLAAVSVEAKAPDSASNNTNNANNLNKSLANNCRPSQAVEELALNNVRARLETGGSMWQNRTTGTPAYFVPRGTGQASIYAGALWMGGLAPDGVLKLAANKFRSQGRTDFFTGPLEAGTAETNEEDCSNWDRFFPISRSQVVAHKTYFDCVEDPDCDLVEAGLDGYIVPDEIRRWPGNGIEGRVNPRHDAVLAPFFDRPGAGIEEEYEPDLGDYPFYDLTGEIECFSDDRRVPLFGDFTLYWIFNDRGNVHTESQGDPIGMEIRTQAFAFVTDDEVNNMTFYNYTLINQGSQTLNDTWFGQWVDPDIGGSEDDYVGSDVSRGLGFCFNGLPFDASQGASLGYENFPPSIGVDFFQGPYQDNDGTDNPLTQDLSWSDLNDLRGIPYGGIGIGYSDGIPDNERFGMRRFVYHERTGNQINVDPQSAPQYYNFLLGRWRNGQRMTYGGLGLTPPNAADPWSGPNPVTDYMFPSDPSSNVNSDPFGFGIRGRTDLGPWSELTVPNPVGDRRFMQSAGPFTLQPGAVNNITVGVVWAQTPSPGGNLISVQLMKVANTKAQNLFDNCFQILEGPNAPQIQIRELENELILYLVNPPSSNNFGLGYAEVDPNIPDTRFDEDGIEVENDKVYRFEGYKVYQVRDAAVSVSELNDVNRARLLFTTDIKNGISDIWNFEQDLEDPAPFAVPRRMVEGVDEGIISSFRFTQDLFADGSGSSRIVNHKSYYFIAIAYAYNNYDDYDPVTTTGQPRSYLPSRSGPGGSGSPIISYAGIPHAVEIRDGGTVLNSRYGDEFQVSRLEGNGNGGNALRITPDSENQLFEQGIIFNPRYEKGFAPLNVKVVDPIRVKNADFEMIVNEDNDDFDDPEASIGWKLVAKNVDGEVLDQIPSDRSLSIKYEQLFQTYGISVTVDNPEMLTGFGVNPPELHDHWDLIGSSLTFPNNGPRFLAGIPDAEDCSPLNWIRQGETRNDDDATCNDRFDLPTNFENIAGGIVGPWNLVHAGPNSPSAANRINPWHSFRDVAIANYPSIEIVVTPDKSKWSRAMVIELQDNPQLAEGNAPKMQPRRSPSVDKNGNFYNGPENETSEDPNDANFVSATGMGWFPGYVYDVETGERLNVAFGENSWLQDDNGRDMLWNPSSRIRQNQALGNTWYLGGQHYLYVYRNYDRQRKEANPNAADAIGAYDEGRYMINNPTSNNLWRGCAWVYSPLLAQGFNWLPVEQGLVPGEARVSVRLAKPLSNYNPYLIAEGDATNNGNPLFNFSTRGFDTKFGELATKKEAFKDVKIVPNPYYAYTSYEANKNDTRIRITNLPRECTVNIYNINGTLVRTLRKGDDTITSLDWDLRNEAQIPIAGGVYLFHIKAPGVGETVLKWFGSFRQQDFENF